MLKISKFKIEEGLTFQIRNSWRDQIIKELKKEEDSYPFSFKIVEIFTNEDKSISYLCESISEIKSRKISKLIVSDIIIRYLLGTEVEDSNVGLYFNNYLQYN